MKEYKWFYETCRVIVTVFVALLIRLRVAGVHNVPKEGPVILVGNHLNWTDIPMIGLRLGRRTHFMAKSELFQKAPLKWLVIGLGAFPVRRGEADRQAIKQAEEVLKAGQVLVIFPEGTRSKTHMMKEGLPGAALIAVRSGAPVVPVGIYGSEKFKLWHLWPFRTKITITYGEPFILSRGDGKRGHLDLQAQLGIMMRHIAELVPPQYQGKYAQVESDAPAEMAQAQKALPEQPPAQPGAVPEAVTTLLPEDSQEAAPAAAEAEISKDTAE